MISSLGQISIKVSVLRAINWLVRPVEALVLSRQYQRPYRIVNGLLSIKDHAQEQFLQQTQGLLHEQFADTHAEEGEKQ